MLDTKELLNGLSASLALRFFATFARLEYAMKQCGYLQSNGDRKTAHASRRHLEARLSENFFEAARQSRAARFLIARPPKKLFVSGFGPPTFEPQPPPLKSTRELLDAIWTVRNNLFHGNKMFPADRVRDRKLMLGALASIDLLLQDDLNLQAAFHEPLG